MFLNRRLYRNSARVLILVLSVWACSINFSWAQTVSASKNILILHSHHFNLPAYEKINIGLETALLAGGVEESNIMVEFMDLGRNPDPDYLVMLNSLLHKRYDHVKIDLIITTYNPAANFMLGKGADFLPHIPMIAMLGPENVADRVGQRPLVLAPGRMDMLGTLKSAIALLPDTQRALVICGPSDSDKHYENQARREFDALKGRLKIAYLNNLPMEEILRKVAAQPPHTVIIFLNFSRDITGKPFTPRDVLENISQSANAPVFGLYDTLIDYGAVGGSMLSFQAEGARVGQIALDILKGKVLKDSPQNYAGTAKYIFDWEQLDRWGLSEAGLPADSIVINRPYSIWVHYKTAILGTLGLIILLSFAIIALLLNILKRRQMEKALKNSEQRFRAIFDSTFQFTGLMKGDGTLIEANKTAIDFAGATLADTINKPFWDTLWWKGNSTRVQQLKEAVARAAKGEFIRYEIELQGANDKTAIVDFSLKPVLNEEGDVVLLIPEGRDVTDRKHAEEALRESESRAQGMLRAIPDLMFRLDRHGVFLDYKADTSDLYVQSQPSLIGQRNRDIAPPEFADFIDGQIRIALETGALQTFEYQLAIPGRGLRNYEARMVASGIDEVTAIVRDGRARTRRQFQYPVDQHLMAFAFERNLHGWQFRGIRQAEPECRR